MPKLYTQEDFDNAIAAIKCGLSYRKASMQFGVPKSTLTDRIAGGKNKRQEQIFTPQEEEGFVEYFHRLSERECGLNSLEVRNIIKCWLDRDKRTVLRFKDNMPTSNWVTQFKRRHPSLNIKPLKTAKPVRIKMEMKQESYVDVVAVEKVSPDSTQESLMEQNISSPTSYGESLLGGSIQSRIGNCSIPSSAMEHDDSIPTIVRPISPLVVNHELSSSSMEPQYPSSSLNKDSPSPTHINCESPPLIVHPSSEKTVFERKVLSSGINRNNLLSTRESLNSRRMPSYTASSTHNSDHSHIDETSSDMPHIHSKNYIALKALEDTLTDREKDMFYRRFEEPHSLELDVLYIAWKVLKHRCANDESPTMVNYYLRSDERSSFPHKRTESIPNPVAEETMSQLQEIINKYQNVDMCRYQAAPKYDNVHKYNDVEEDKKPVISKSVIVTNSVNND